MIIVPGSIHADAEERDQAAAHHSTTSTSTHALCDLPLGDTAQAAHRVLVLDGDGEVIAASAVRRA